MLEEKMDKMDKMDNNNNNNYIFSFNYIQYSDKKRESQQKNVSDKKITKILEQNDLKNNDIFSHNEIDISEKIKMISGWQKYTNPILHSSLVSGLNKYIFVKERMDFSLYSFLYSFLKEKNKGEQKGEQKDEILQKETFVQIIGIYNSLLKVLEWTCEQNGLITLSCNLNNIYLDKNGKVKLGDFSHSFFINDINAIILNNEFKIENKSLMPLGLYILHYLKQMTTFESLSSNNICELCSHYINELIQIGDLFSADFLKEYEQKCIFSLQSFINMKKERIILELLKGSSYWDHFSMSFVFLIMLKITGIFHSEFIELMLNNIMYSKKNVELTFC